MKQATLLLALAAVSCSGEPEAPRVTARDAVITLPAVPGSMGAAYFTLETNAGEARLVAISSPSARAIELHETRQDGGRSRMVPLAGDGLRFDSDAPLQFAPGGKHGMVMGMDPSVQVGGKVTLNLQVEPGGTVSVEADVRGPGQAHAGH